MVLFHGNGRWCLIRIVEFRKFRERRRGDYSKGKKGLVESPCPLVYSLSLHRNFLVNEFSLLRNRGTIPWLYIDRFGIYVKLLDQSIVFLTLSWSTSTASKVGYRRERGRERGGVYLSF